MSYLIYLLQRAVMLRLLLLQLVTRTATSAARLELVSVMPDNVTHDTLEPTTRRAFVRS